MFGSFVLLLLFQRDWGIDTFGPVHAFEMVLPILGLTIAGAKNLAERLARQDEGGTRGSVAVVGVRPVASSVAHCDGLVGLRTHTARGRAADCGSLNAALHAPARAGVDRAVIFSPRPSPLAAGWCPPHFVFFRPVNDPDLRNDVLWVNHVNVEEDRRLVESLAAVPAMCFSGRHNAR